MGDLIQPAHLIILLIVGGPLLAIHFLPTIVAAARHAQNLWWILLVNLLTGWTCIGWVIALIWAIRNTPRYVVGYVPPPPPPATVG
jgi:hypothetical protein